MKKIYLTLAGMIFSATMMAQAPINQMVFQEAPAHHTARDLKAPHNFSNRYTIDKVKFNFIDLSSSYYSSTPDYDYYYTFPDSTPFADYGGSLGAPFCHSFGQVYDLSSPVMNQNTLGYPSIFDISSSTTIDSIATYGVWGQSRSGATDTIIFRVVVPTTGVNLDRVFYFTGTASNYPASNDTTRFAMLNTDSNTWVVPGAIAEYKVPLRVQDTLANGLQYVKTPAGVNVDRVFAVTIDFKPGSTYTPYVDTMGFGVGSWTQVTAELNGDGTYSNYVPGDLTASNTVTSQVRHAAPGGGWNGRYIPYLAYGAGIYESIDIDLTLSQTNAISVKENVSEAKLFQNYPNPANAFTTVKYALENNAEVTFEVIDVTGKKVISTFEGNRNAGTHTIEINSNELNAGLYFYSIVVNGKRITKKMTITK